MRNNFFSACCRQAVAAVGCVGVAVLLSACGGDESNAREYDLPSNFCGVEVPTGLYDPIFPPGGEVESRGRFDGAVPAGLNCSYRVDGETAVMSGTSGDSEFDSFLAVRGLDYSMSEAENVAGEYEALVWPGFVMAKAPCTVGDDESAIIRSFTVAVQVQHPEDGEESKRILSEFIQPYMAALLDQIPCAEYGAGEGGE
ncbi:hypothetical protein ACL02R_13235 [Streptomyces sp. MS19]|uniref:hypothetical protein n=1 Tax=Streptomyces sp. MS19 TaxID=3385972 RepID=UPI0039A00A5E